MKNHQRSGRAGFTLIELLAVITIIVILAGLVVGGMGYVNEKQARGKAQTQVQLLSKALEEYKLEMGYYPRVNTAATDPTGNSATVYAKLFYEGYEYINNPSRADSTTDPKATRIYLAELDPTTSKQGWVDAVTTSNAKPPATTTIKDPWGNEYRYRPGKKADGTVFANTINPDFDLWSVGKDGKTQGGNTATNIKDPVNNDDIRNF